MVMDFFERLQDGVSSDEWAGLILLGLVGLFVLGFAIWLIVSVMIEVCKRRNVKPRRHAVYERSSVHMGQVPAKDGDLFIDTDTGKVFIFMEANHRAR